ncbi:hypothetical protein QBC37DRAFT_398287 [Rhypophila decipiens]|uniref:Uncharacterized protein n=1 Tax=Rhypophila decipiens TaxID=261697 RepID=A0AAN7BCA6_9PEZI|nr:hypothetical protein QBC37DRAFT_398287 [Rhypophila decipiens]
MYLPSVLGYALLFLHQGLLVAGADVAYIKASIANMTADIQSIKETAQSINTNTDFLAYAAGTGNYKAMQDKLTALKVRTGVWNTQIQGSTIPSTATADITAIVSSFQTLGIELIATLAAVTDKAGLFATTPVVGQPIANSIAGYSGAFGLYAVIIRALNPQIDSQIVGSIGAIYIIFPLAENKYKGVVC